MSTEPEQQETLNPVDIALVAMQGLLSSGVYNENPQAAAVMAWHCVLPFFEGMEQFAQMQRAMMAQQG